MKNFFPSGQDPTASLADRLTGLARAHRILEMQGHGDLTLGHLSLRDPGGRGLWLKKPGRGLDEVQGPQDFVLISFEGKQLENGGACHAEWPIHAEIMKARPEVNAVGHTHPYHAIMFSATAMEIEALSHEGANYTGRVPRFLNTAGLINTVPLARELTEALGAAPAIIMKNHGLTYVGHSVKELTLHGIFLEEACRMQLQLAATGLPWSGSDLEHIGNRRFDPRGNGTSPYIDTFFDYYDRKLSRRER